MFGSPMGCNAIPVEIAEVHSICGELIAPVLPCIELRLIKLSLCGGELAESFQSKLLPMQWLKPD
jgi:hypothetical protein